MRLIESYLKRPVARVLLRLGIRTNQLTLAGGVFTLIDALLVGFSLVPIWVGGIIFLAAASTDLFDGALSRLDQRPHDKALGGFLDTMTDKFVEIFIHLSLWFVLDANLWRILVLASLVTALEVSETKARAAEYNLDIDWWEVQFLGHPARVLGVGLGMFLTAFFPTQETLLATFGGLTAFNCLCLIERNTKVFRAIKNGSFRKT